MKKLYLFKAIMVQVFLCLAYISNAQNIEFIVSSEEPIDIKIAEDIKKFNEFVNIDSSKSSFTWSDLTAGKVAILQHDVLQKEAYNDLVNSTNNTGNIRVLLPLADREIHIIAKATDKKAIRSFQELKRDGIKLAVGPKGQATATTADVIKDLTGAQWTEIYNPNLREAIRKLLKSEIDAFICIGTAPIEELKIFSILAPHEQKNIKLIPISDVALNDSYQKTKITSGTYKWAPYDVETFAVRTFIVTSVASEDDPDRAAYQKMLDNIKSNILQMQRQDGLRTEVWKQVTFGYGNITWKIHDVPTEMYIDEPEATKKDGDDDDSKKP